VFVASGRGCLDSLEPVLLGLLLSCLAVFAYIWQQEADKRKGQSPAKKP
jgi:hypothetical protein